MTIRSKRFYAVSDTGRGWMIYKKTGEGFMRIDRRQRAYVLKHMRWLDKQEDK